MVYSVSLEAWHRAKSKEIKMAFISISKLRNKHYSPRQVSSSRPSDLTFSTYIGGTSKAGIRKYYLVIVVGAELLKKARFMIKDKVDVLFDPEDGCGLIKRTMDGTLNINATSKNKPPNGKIVVTLSDGMPYVKTSKLCDSVEINEEGILFRIPGYSIYSKDESIKEIDERLEK